MPSFDPLAWPNRLNLGCGYDRREGYLNVDFQAAHAPDLLADVRDLRMLPPGHFEEIVAQDVLEHLPRADGPKALREWSRLLRPGGRLVLRVPNLLGLAYVMTWKQSIEEQEELVQCLFGTQAYDGDFHQNGYTELLLRHRLREAGFGEATFEPFCEWLFNVTAVKVPPTGPPPTFDECMFMTLRKPSEVFEGVEEPSPLPEPEVPPVPELPPEPGIRQSARDLARAVRRRIRRGA